VKRTPPDRRAQAKRAALNALRRAQRAADRAGVKLSEWEGEFLGSVAERVTTYGRAFGDPEKGAPGAALSARQGVKLKEIASKATGKRGPSFRRRRPLGNSSEPD
jgi:nucleotide-binding universal stress UspA family protein